MKSERSQSTNAYISGISAIVTDTKDLAEQETPIYVCVAVVISIILFIITYGFIYDTGILPFEYWYGYSLQLRKQFCYGRNILHNKGISGGTSVRCYNGLLHFPMAQL